MSDYINNYYNPNIRPQGTQFQGGPVQNLKDNGRVSDMGAIKDFPTTPQEMKRFIPSWLAALGMGYGVKQGVNYLSKAKDASNTYVDAFEKTRFAKAGQAVDNFAYKNFGGLIEKTNQWKSKLSGKTPQFLQDLMEKFKIGTSPSSTGLGKMTKGFLGGIGGQAIDDVLDNLVKVYDQNQAGKEKIANLGLKDIVLDHKHNGGAVQNADDALDKVLKALKKKNVKVSDLRIEVPNSMKLAGRSVKIPGKPQVLDLDTFITRAKLLKGQGAKTWLGKAVHKLSLGSAEGFAGFIGGKFGFLMNSFFLGSGVYRASQAEKGDKVSTFMESLIGDMIGGYLIMFPIQKAFYNNFLSLKHIDKTPQQVRDIKKNIKLYNKQAKDFRKFAQIEKKLQKLNGAKVGEKFANSIAKHFDVIKADEIKNLSAEEALKAMQSKVKPKLGTAAEINKLRDEVVKAHKYEKRIFDKAGKEIGKKGFLRRLGEKLVRLPAKLFSAGHGKDDLVAKLSKGPFKTTMHNMKRFSKLGFGATGRFLMITMVLTEPFRKLFIKGSHAIFGKPKHSLLDEGKDDATKKAEQINKSQAFNTQKVGMQDFLSKTHKSQPTAPAKTVLKPNKPVVQPKQPIAAKAINKEQVNEGLEPKRTYIPSPVAASRVNQLNSSKPDGRAAKAIAEADFYEKQATDLLNGL